MKQVKQAAQKIKTMEVRGAARIANLQQKPLKDMRNVLKIILTLK